MSVCMWRIVHMCLCLAHLSVGLHLLLVSRSYQCDLGAAKYLDCLIWRAACSACTRKNQRLQANCGNSGWVGVLVVVGQWLELV